MPKFLTPQAAEAAFYAAFESADLEMMMNIWADSEEIACIHPMGSCLHGRHLIQQGWQSVFHKGSQMQFQLTSIHRTVSMDTAVHVLYENISLKHVKNPVTPIITTNIFRLFGNSWQMILHHASLSPFEAGQTTVRH